MHGHDANANDSVKERSSGEVHLKVERAWPERDKGLPQGEGEVEEKEKEKEEEKDEEKEEYWPQEDWLNKERPEQKWLGEVWKDG